MSDRPAPDRKRGPTRPLSERAARFAARMAMTDRRARFARRLEQVTAERRSRVRRRRLARALSRLFLAAVVLTAGGLLAGWAGTVLGAGLLLVSAVGVVVAGRLARRRGATAWDWQVQEYRLLGNPSEDVRRRDPPKGPGTIGDG
ncbi:MAG: hypothetical protein ACRDUY_01745 [Nitriliruptorales bacterium]